MIIPKVKIQTTLSELDAVIDALQSISTEALPFREVKTAHSVLHQVEDILIRKRVAKKTSTKPFTLALEFYQAHHLEEFVRLHNAIAYNNESQKLSDKLNQKVV
jgi:hypothetical protein